MFYRDMNPLTINLKPTTTFWDQLKIFKSKRNVWHHRAKRNLFSVFDLVKSRCFCRHTPISASSGAPLNKPFLVLGQCDWVGLALIPPLFLVAKWACDSGLPNKWLPSPWIQHSVQRWPPNGLIWLSPGACAGLMIWRSRFSLEITTDKEDRILKLPENKANTRGGRTVQKQKHENSLHHSRTWMQLYLKSRLWTLRLEINTSLMLHPWIF